MIGAGSGLECVRAHDSERAREWRMENERARAKKEEGEEDT